MDSVEVFGEGGLTGVCRDEMMEMAFESLETGFEFVVARGGSPGRFDIDLFVIGGKLWGWIVVRKKVL